MKSFKNVPVLRGLTERATGPGGIVDNEKKYLLRRSCRLPLFLIVFFLIYGSVHGYALLKAKSALGFGWGTAAAPAPVLIALTLAPLIIYFLGRHGMEEAARAVSWVGYTWGGLLFFFFWMNLAVDALNLVARLGGALSGRWGSASLVSGKAPFLALVALSVALGASASFEAREIGVERVRIVTDKLPPSTSRVRIAQISDVHLGLLVRHRQAGALPSVVRRAGPHPLASTGDRI